MNGKAENYLSINKASWNRKTSLHLDSDFYQMEAFKKGATSLNDIELGLLGDIKGKSVLHLQCHFGQDSLSLARMGAKVTGIDLSDEAIKQARLLNDELGLDASFVVSDVYDLPNQLTGQFDIVFTSYGTVGWLPDLDQWAGVIQHFLKPGGQFVFAEFHPNVWMYDDDFTKVSYNYFNDGPIIETETGTYANQEDEQEFDYVFWNHSLSEVFTALISAGLQIKQFQEFDYSPYNAFRHTEKIADRKYRITSFGNKMPLVYALSAMK